MVRDEHFYAVFYNDEEMHMIKFGTPYVYVTTVSLFAINKHHCMQDAAVEW